MLRQVSVSILRDPRDLSSSAVRSCSGAFSRSASRPLSAASSRVPAGRRSPSKGRAANDGVAGEALADVAVDYPAQRMARRHQSSVLPFMSGELQPARAGRADEIVGIDLGDAVAEFVALAVALVVAGAHPDPHSETLL